MIGLYLHPPTKALVLCCDEKSQCQALERTQLGLPLAPRCTRTMTHDYTLELRSSPLAHWASTHDFVKNRTLTDFELPLTRFRGLRHESA